MSQPGRWGLTPDQTAEAAINAGLTGDVLEQAIRDSHPGISQADISAAMESALERILTQAGRIEPEAPAQTIGEQMGLPPGQEAVVIERIARYQRGDGTEIERPLRHAFQPAATAQQVGRWFQDAADAIADDMMESDADYDIVSWSV